MPPLERRFRDYLNGSSRINRIALFAMAAFAVFMAPLLDTRVFGMPEAAVYQVRLVQFGWMMPLLAFAVTWCICWPRNALTEWVMAGQFVLFCGGLLTYRLLMDRYGADFPIEFVAVGLVGIIALGRIRAWIMLPTGVFVCLGGLTVDLLWVDPSPGEYFGLGAAGVLALIAAYVQYSSEYFLRGVWLDRELLRRISRRDGLTSLLNRNALENALAVAHAHAVRERQGYGLAMIDIDRFGDYNDRYGHPAGDEALRQVADRIDAHARRPLDTCGRYGGEEFVVFWMEAGADEVAAGEAEDGLAGVEGHAERLRSAIEALGIEHAGSEISRYVTVSIGLCLVERPDRHTTLSAVLTTADQLLYRAKRGGRNRVVAEAFVRQPDTADDDDPPSADPAPSR